MNEFVCSLAILLIAFGVVKISIGFAIRHLKKKGDK